MKATRINLSGLEGLERELDERDRAVIDMLGRLKLSTGNQLRRAHWPSDTPAHRRATRRTLQRLTDWRVIARLDRRLGGLGRGSDSYTYALDVAGQRLLRGNGGRRPRLPRPAMWTHALAVTEVYVRLVEALRDTDAALAEWQGEPDSWRRFSGAAGEQLVIKPDAGVRIQGRGYSDAFFIEVDTGSQSRTVIKQKLAAYRRYAASGAEQIAAGVFPQVVFLTTSPERHAVLIDVVGAEPPDSWPLFAVGLVADCAALLLPPAPEAAS